MWGKWELGVVLPCCACLNMLRIHDFLMIHSAVPEYLFPEGVSTATADNSVHSLWAAATCKAVPSLPQARACNRTLPCNLGHYRFLHLVRLFSAWMRLWVSRRTRAVWSWTWTLPGAVLQSQSHCTTSASSRAIRCNQHRAPLCKRWALTFLPLDHLQHHHADAAAGWKKCENIELARGI